MSGANWTTIATALITGLVGYFGARLQYSTRMRELETAAAGPAKEREYERLVRLEKLYFDFLATARRFYLYVDSGRLTSKTEVYDEYERGLMNHFVNLDLGAPSAVRDRAREMMRVIDNVIIEAKKGEGGHDSWEHAFTDAWKDHHRAWTTARRGLQDAMRTDLDALREGTNATPGLGGFWNRRLPRR